MEISSGVRTLTLAETFTIARGSTDAEEVVWAEIRHGGHVGRGEGAPDDRYGESVEASPRVHRRRRRRARRRPVRARGDRDAPARARRLGRRLLRGRMRAARPRRQARRAADLAPARARRPHAGDLVHDRHRLDRGHGRPRRGAAEAGYRRLKVKLGGEGDLERLRGDPRASATCRCGSTPTRAGTSTRRARLLPDARRARRRVDRAAVPGRRARRVPRAARRRQRHPAGRRRGLPHAARRRRRRHLRRRRQSQAREDGRHPRGRAHGARGARARPRRHARLHDRELRSASRRRRSSRRSATSSTSTATC